MSYISDPLSSPEVFFYMLEGYYVLDDDIDFIGMDSLLVEVATNLEKNPTHSGGGRDFQLELETFDEESKSVEIIASFVVRLWEDDDNEINLIVSTIVEELERVGVQVEETEWIGIGRRGHFY